MLKDYMRCDYEIGGKVSLFIRNNIKKIVLKNLLRKDCFHNKITKTQNKT